MQKEYLTVSQIQPTDARRPALARLPRIYRSNGEPIRVLLVDDEVVLTNLVSLALGYEGWIVDVAHNGSEAIEKYRAERPDVVVLDIMLPDMDGLDILGRLREFGDGVPSLFLTARDSVEDRILGLTAGDDYMTKPLSLGELVARLRGLLRRVVQTVSEDTRITVGDLFLDEPSHIVKRAGETITLTGTEFELLLFLMRNSDVVPTRTQILERV